MDISVIIPVYCVENYIKDCIQSVVNQSFKGSLECVIVDDCSSDNSWDIVEDVVKNYEGDIVFKLIRHNKNKGVSEARNAGLKHSTGDYVYFLDSDDTITVKCLETLSQSLKDYSYDFVFANHNYIGDYEFSIPLRIPLGPIKNAATIRKYFRDGWFILAWNKLINRQFLLRNNLFFEEGLIHEDELWSFKLACVAGSIYVLNDRTYNYKFNNPNSITSDIASFRHFEAYTEVLRQQILAVTQFNLKNDLYLYYHIEESKRWRMKDAVKLLDVNEAFLYYKKIRNWHYEHPLIYPFDLKYTVRNWIRDIHYFLPSRLGYKYMNLLNKL